MTHISSGLYQLRYSVSTRGSCLTFPLPHHFNTSTPIRLQTSFLLPCLNNARLSYRLQWLIYHNENMTTEEWKQQERRIIDEFFKIKVPKTLGSRPSDRSRASLGSTSLESKSAADYGCSETSCIHFAKTITKSDDIVLVDNQGSNSLTLFCPSKSQVIQFRLKPFDTTSVDLAHQIYHNKVPRAVLHKGFPLPVYSSDIIPGRVHVLQPFPEDKFPLEREKATVIDLGCFVARATFFPQSKSSYNSTSWVITAKEMLDRLQRNVSLQKLAPEVAKVVVRLQTGLYRLSDLPAVLTHHDFAQVNIFVNDVGKVTGVIDFDEAGIEPFGMCIWGLYEGFFGCMEGGKWSFYKDSFGHWNNQQVFRPRDDRQY